MGARGRRYRVGLAYYHLGLHLVALRTFMYDLACHLPYRVMCVLKLVKKKILGEQNKYKQKT